MQEKTHSIRSLINRRWQQLGDVAKQTTSQTLFLKRNVPTMLDGVGLSSSNDSVWPFIRQRNLSEWKSYNLTSVRKLHYKNEV